MTKIEKERKEMVFVLGMNIVGHSDTQVKKIKKID